MRITAETKETTRKKILAAAESQFHSLGYAATTTRDIARAAGIANGTLFNYFATKEAIVCSLVQENQPSAVQFSSDGLESLEEALFAYTAQALRQLKPYRSFLMPLVETMLSPLAHSTPDDSGQALRTTHLEAVCRLAKPFVDDAALTSVTLQMYWTLYLGVLTFWIGDQSPRQEDTLALLDQSLEMFTGWLLRPQA